jgi:hypothetical protein
VVAVVAELPLLVHIPIPSQHQQLLALVGVEVGEGAVERPPWRRYVTLLAALTAPAAQGCNRICLTESATVSQATFNVGCNIWRRKQFVNLLL